MAKLLMISGDRSLAQEKKGAFYNTLEEFHKYWDRIDIITPRTRGLKNKGVTRLGVPHGAQIEIEHHGGEEGQDPVLGDNVFMHPSPWPLIFQPFWILKKGLDIYRAQKFDLITVHEYPPFYNGIGAKMLWNKIKVPYVLEIHHVVGYPKTADLKEKFYRWLTGIFIKYDSSKAKAVRAVNQKQVPEFLVKVGVPQEKILYIPSLYIDLGIFRPMNLEKNYDLIFIGRLVKNKGINLLLEAVSKLKTQNSNFKLLVVGAGPLVNFLKLKIENLKLKNNVLLYGWAESPQKIAELMNQSRVLIMPSYNEGGPRVVVEAMACGVPILATPVGIVADIMKDGQFGRLIKWDAEDIAKKAESLLFNKLEYQKYSEAALKTAGRFERKSAIRNYAEKLQELI